MQKIPLISLWELMQKFSPEEFLSLGRSALISAQLMQGYEDTARKRATLQQYRDQMKTLWTLCDKADMSIANRTITRIIELADLHLGGGVRLNGEPFETGAQNVMMTLEDELSIRLCFWLDSSEAALWKAKRLCGEDVSDKFPSTDYELEEYGKCCAVGRYTAAVFHLMRVLEIGLSAVADSIGADPFNKSWEQILIGITKKIEENSKLKGPDWKEVEQYYSELAAQFRNVKNAWRNYTMHVHVTYDRERTEEIFVHVRAIMKVLATRVREKV